MKEDKMNVTEFILMGLTQDSQMQIILFLLLLIIYMANRWGKKMETVTNFIFLDSKITADVTTAMKLKDTCSLEENYDKSRQHIKKQRHDFADKDL